MGISRRWLLKAGALGTAAAGLKAGLPQSETQPQSRPLPREFDKLRPLGNRVQPIVVQEFQGRIALAQRLMTEAKPRLDALFVTPGSSLYYYTGIRWQPSERLLALVVPRNALPVIICPAFEEPRLRDLLRFPIEVRTWQEDGDPHALVAKSLQDRGVRTGRIAVEEQTRFHSYDGLRKAAPHFDYRRGNPVTVGCRGRKTQHELELMRLACQATVQVYQAAFASLHEGMTQHELAALISQGFERMGLPGGALVLFGRWAALPHGTTQAQKLTEGQVVLVDGGTSVEGYASDVTRCTVLGKPSDKLKRAFDTVRRAQEAALAAALPARQAGSVDDAARRVITDAGYGTGYQFFTHRLGHGIGLDGHEHPYLVRGSRTVLQPGMTFSNEPGIYVSGEYGLRLEDDMVIAEYGPAQLLTPAFSRSLESPFG